LIAGIDQALGDFHQEKRVRAIILTGSGSAFCAGMDLSEMLSTAQSENAQSQWQEDASIYRDLLERMLLFPKPIIAAINGPAMAGGLGLLLASDLVVAAHSAKFGLPEPKRGLVAGMVTPLLAFRIGAGQSARMLLTAEPIDAAAALQIGLIHECMAEQQLWARAMEIANQCAQSAPEALQLTKRMLNEVVGEHLSTMLSAGAAVSATARTTESAHEGLAAFLEKREPHWP
jgi:methylglutaconyl-CoA hydratase